MKSKKFPWMALALAASLLLPALVRAGGPGTSGAVELKIPLGARAVAMGDAYGAVANDANSIYWNPAGLRQLGGVHLTAQYNDFLDTLKYNYLAVASPMSKGKRGIGLSVMMMSTGKSDEVDGSGNVIGTISESFMNVNLGYAQKINYHLDLGITVKYVSKKLSMSQSASGSTFAGDIGILYHPPVKNFTAGFVIQNLGPGMKIGTVSYGLPRNFKIATAYKMLDNNLTAALDVNFPSDNKPVASLGGEYWYKNRLVGRAGYRYQGGLDWNELGNGGKANVFVGAGLKFQAMGTVLGLDYAWADSGVFGNIHRVGLNVYL